jgi:BirA family biotin operon repressor/biotin-[acetyl-CoA-carboxylase] ligase
MQTLADTLTFIRSVDSTNNYAIAALHAALAKHGDAFLAGYQTAGKGQRGKQWLAKPNENLLFSVVVEPKLLITQQFLLSMAVALACSKLLNHYAQDNIFIKWPNDIYWNDRKAGGILIENIITEGNWRYAVVGIGINLNQVSFENTANQPVSLRQITGKVFNIKSFARELAGFLEIEIQSLYKDAGETVSKYNSQLFRLNQLVTLKKDNISSSFRINGVNKWGELLAFSSVENQFRIGEVEWIL